MNLSLSYEYGSDGKLKWGDIHIKICQYLSELRIKLVSLTLKLVAK